MIKNLKKELKKYQKNNLEEQNPLDYIGILGMKKVLDILIKANTNNKKIVFSYKNKTKLIYEFK